MIDAAGIVETVSPTEAAPLQTPLPEPTHAQPEVIKDLEKITLQVQIRNTAADIISELSQIPTETLQKTGIENTYTHLALQLPALHDAMIRGNKTAATYLGTMMHHDLKDLSLSGLPIEEMTQKDLTKKLEDLKTHDASIQEIQTQIKKDIYAKAHIPPEKQATFDDMSTEQIFDSLLLGLWAEREGDFTMGTDGRILLPPEVIRRLDKLNQHSKAESIPVQKEFILSVAGESGNILKGILGIDIDTYMAQEAPGLISKSTATSISEIKHIPEEEKIGYIKTLASRIEDHIQDKMIKFGGRKKESGNYLQSIGMLCLLLTPHVQKLLSSEEDER